ncbi:MAG: phosphotriesterase-related protein, partial [Chloroflexi bacterium]|nr:phosphotriesterase-related protein [Chloroflexota bacterium]
MAISKIAGKVQTVLGVIESQNLGLTLTHEHLFIDGKCIFTEPEGASERALAYEPVDWHNLSWLRYHPYENLDNMRLLDEQDAIDEAMLFKKAGG